MRPDNDALKLNITPTSSSSPNTPNLTDPSDAISLAAWVDDWSRSRADSRALVDLADFLRALASTPAGLRRVAELFLSGPSPAVVALLDQAFGRATARGAVAEAETLPAGVDVGSTSASVRAVLGALLRGGAVPGDGTLPIARAVHGVKLLDF